MQQLYLAANPTHLNEALNVNGPNRCTVDSQCDGFRTCSSYGWCHGVAGTFGVDYGVLTPVEEPVYVTPSTKTYVDEYNSEGITNFNNGAGKGDTQIHDLNGL